MLHFMQDALTPVELPGVAVVDLDSLGGLPPPLGVEVDAAEKISETAGNAKNGQRFLARRAAARQMASAISGVAPHKVGISTSGDGLQFFEPELQGLSMSFSHRGRYCAIAIARSPVGVDLEKAGEVREIPWNVLHPEEQRELRSLDEARRMRAFLRLWTAKEAHLKAQGVGLAREPSSFVVRGFADPEPWRMAVDDPGGPVDGLEIACREFRALRRELVVTAGVWRPV